MLRVCSRCAFAMAASGQRGAKRSRTEALFEGLMLRMDAMDQAIASLRTQSSVSDLTPSDQAERPGRPGVPPREAFSPVLKKV
ncbi:hypothetical protein NDU88_007378 [Pleurodeles waltl]|uniref:Uncharacterized protein n=1 Tax=Pleurodeles waltl TaxID=8319 RepID=A0AAV7U247_PLEWA|nr:hypothetical protein NDU88_007378 [Pleurodeles waltl]